MSVTENQNKEIKIASVTLMITILVILAFLTLYGLSVIPGLCAVYEHTISASPPLVVVLLLRMTSFFRHNFIFLGPLGAFFAVGVIAFEQYYKNSARKITLYSMCLILIFLIVLSYFTLLLGSLVAAVAVLSG